MISNFWFVCVFFAGRMAWDLRFSSGLREPNFVANTVADTSVNGYRMSNRRMLCMKKTYSFCRSFESGCASTDSITEHQI